MNDTAPSPEAITDSEFTKLGIETALVSALVRLGMDAPTDIQRAVIPPALEGRDCLATASTGAGKTNAYLLPILQNLKPGESLQAVIVQPTRALALQLDRNIKRFAPDCELKTAVASGARRGHEDDNPLDSDPDVLIATPRGAADLVRQDADRDWSSIRTVVIDEIDAIVDDRGPENLERFHTAMSHDHQTILLTGEIDDAVRELADTMLDDPFEASAEPGPPRALDASQGYFAIGEDDKFDALITFCKQQKPKLAIVMVNDERQGHEVADRLDRVRVTCRWIGEKRGPARRDQRGGGRSGGGGGRDRSEVIVACDPAPRRLSTIPATHLVHYEIPDNVDVYMRRLDQAARLRRAGSVIVFVEEGQDDLREQIEQRTGKPLTKLDTPERPEHLKRDRGGSRDRGGDRGGRGGDRGGRGDRAPRGGRDGRRSDKPRSSGGGNSQSRGGSQSNANKGATGRLNQTLHPDTDLDSRGVKPPPRTLGNRFRPNSRPKRLRRPGK